MRYLTLILVLAAFSSFGQEQDRNFGIAEVFHGGDSIFIKRLLTQVVYIGEGTVTKMQTPPDTAKLFIASDGGIYQGVIVWHKVGTPPVDPPAGDIVIDIDDAVGSANKYEPAANLGVNQPNPTGWLHYANNGWNANHLNKSASFISVNGYLETTFDGYKVEWHTEKRTNHGIAAISIDGGAEVMIDLYDATLINNYRLAWTSPELTSGTHKVKIRFTGTKNPASDDTNIIHDFFRVYKKG